MKAIWNNVVIAESDATIVVEKNHYFPPESLNMEHFVKSKNIYHCPDKGYADYYNVVVSGEENPDSAWVYPHPYPEASAIKGKFAFWRGVSVVE